MPSLPPATTQDPRRESYSPGLFQTFHARHASVYIFPCLLYFRPWLGTLMPSYPTIWNASKWFLYAQRAIESLDPRYRAARFIYNWLLFHTSVRAWCQEGLSSLLAVRKKAFVMSVQTSDGRGRIRNKKTRRVFELESADLSIFLPRPCRVVPCTMYDSIIDLAKSASRVPAVH